jgi:hypothetical protein
MTVKPIASANTIYEEEAPPHKKQSVVILSHRVWDDLLYSIH